MEDAVVSFITVMMAFIWDLIWDSVVFLWDLIWNCVAIGLLVGSNYMFMPGIELAGRRGFNLLSTLYSATMMCSAVYHLEDDFQLFSRWISADIPYSVFLQADYLCSNLSMLCTCITIASPIRLQKYQVLVIGGGISLVLQSVFFNAKAAHTMHLPILFGSLYLIFSWYRHYLQTGSFYFGINFVWFTLIPAIVIALCGVTVFQVFETKWNRSVYHSYWHMCVALALKTILKVPEPLLPVGNQV